MYGYTFDDCYHRSIGCSIEHYGGPVVNVGGVTEALALHRPPVVTSPSILAHGSMPWESRTMMVVAVQGAPTITILVAMTQEWRGNSDMHLSRQFEKTIPLL